MAAYLVEHYGHATPNVSNPAGPTQIGSPVKKGECTPVNLSYEFNAAGFHTVSYDLPVSSEIARWSVTEPYVSDFILYRNGVKWIGGLHTQVEVGANEALISVSGMDWKHWLERIAYPFDLPDVAADFEPVFGVDAADYPVISLVIELIQDVYLKAVAPQGAGFRFVGVKFFFPNAGLIDLINQGPKVDYYEIPYGDQENIYQKVEALARKADGFDWDVMPDRNLRVWLPFRGRDLVSAVVLEDGVNVTDSRLTNPGIRGSRTFVNGTGDAQQDIKLGEHAGSQIKWRRLDAFVDAGDVGDDAELQERADIEDQLSTHGIEQITCTVKPEFDFWNTCQLGDVVKFKFPTQYYPAGYFSDSKRIVNIRVDVSNEGVETIELTLDSSQLAYA